MDFCSKLRILVAVVVFLVIGVAQGGLKDQYVGCYKLDTKQSNWTTGIQKSNNLTIELCISTCNSTFAILQNGNNCFCADTFDASQTDNTCSKPCSGNPSEVCGDITGVSYSVYTACPVGYYGESCRQVCHCQGQLPCFRLNGLCPNSCSFDWTEVNCNRVRNLTSRYIGCYQDNATRALDGTTWFDSGNMTLELCSGQCLPKNYTYFGTQFSSNCFCGNEYSKYGYSPESNCNWRCAGNSDEYCGALYKNSVYTVCPNGSYSTDCTGRCNCRNNSVCDFNTGNCAAGCAIGWTGSSCDVRDCSNSVGGCIENETCVVEDLKFSSVTRCQCLTGYFRSTLWDNCTDIDECQRGFCDEKTTNCSNTIGSFTCTCKKGFANLMNIACSDIDECKNSPCDLTTTSCINRIGSYVCNCITGYENSNGTSCSDINECNLPICDRKTTTCNNTVGGFECNCKAGYVNSNGISCFDNTFTTSIDEKDSSLKRCDANLYSLGIVVGVGFGSAVTVFLIGITVISVYVWRRRNQKNKRKLDNIPAPQDPSNKVTQQNQRDSNPEDTYEKLDSESIKEETLYTTLELK